MIEKIVINAVASGDTREFFHASFLNGDGDEIFSNAITQSAMNSLIGQIYIPGNMPILVESGHFESIDDPRVELLQQENARLWELVQKLTGENS